MILSDLNIDDVYKNKILKDIENNNLSDNLYDNLSNLDWVDISSNITLSENFIRKFKDKVCWYYISFYQSLSQSFIIEFKDYIDFESLMFNKNIEPQIKELCKIFM